MVYQLVPTKKLLTDILRDEWGFKGYVVSDQGALENIFLAHNYSPDLVHAAAAAAMAGTDLEDGNIDIKFLNAYSNLEDAVSKGLIDADVIRTSVSRLFLVRMKLGEFNPPDKNPYTSLNLSVIQSQEHRDLSLKAALESMVLLKNNKTNGLPLGSVDNACLVGPFIENELYFIVKLYTCGGRGHVEHLKIVTPTNLFGDYSPEIMPQYCSTPLSGIKQFTQIGTNTFKTATGCTDGPACKIYDQKKITEACSNVDVIIVTAGISHYLEGEGNDRADISLPGHQLDMLKDSAAASTNAPVVLVLFNAGPLDISWAKENPQVTAIIEAFYPAQSTGQALAMILTGKYNPAGRLPNTWPANLNQVPPITNYTMINRTYRYFKGVPLYPFGYGLSYTKFSYSQLMISPEYVKSGENVTISVTVTNTGEMDGDEVTQVYLHWTNTTIPAPTKQLVGVNRSMIMKGKTLKLTFLITAAQMKIWTSKWIIPLGKMIVVSNLDNMILYCLIFLKAIL